MDLDLIYMNSAKEDVGIMKDFTLDLAYGDSENNFECKIVDKQHCCKEGWFLYIENTEYGGIIDDIAVNSAKGVVTYLGRTWHGILNSKIIQPDNDADYLVVSGEANSVIAMLINRIGVNSLFKAVADNSGITITNYRMHRYISGYDGIVKMLKSVNAKLNMKFNGSYIELSVKPIIDYSKDEQFDTDQIALIIKKKYKKLNHVICLGKGELSNREIIHIYADENGNIVENQVFTGLDEVATVYENVNVTGDELRKGGIDKIKAAWSSDELDFKFNNNEENYDIGDIVGGSEHITGTEVAREITKKIVNISNNTVTVSYPSDTGGGGSYSSGGSSGGESGGGVAVPKVAYNLLDNSDFRNPVNQRGAKGAYGAWGGYTIDRWAAYSEGATISLSNQGLTLTNGIYQPISAETMARYNGKTMTFAVKINGTVYVGSGVFKQNNAWAHIVYVTTPYGDIHFEVENDNMVFCCITCNTQAVVEWAALYEGEYTAATLPEYMPKGYAQELLECQRYYQRIGSTAENMSLGIGVARNTTTLAMMLYLGSMRAVPKMSYSGTVKALSNVTVTGLKPTLDSYMAVSGTQRINFVSSGFTTGYSYLIASESGGFFIEFSADL